MILLVHHEKTLPTYLLLAILVMGAFGVMGGGLVAPALPTIGHYFQIPKEQIGLILSIYTLAAAMSLPFIGYFMDTIGPRRMGLICLTIDGTAGLAIILAPSFGFLLFLRFIQGIGIAGLIPIAMTIMGRLYTGEKRLQVMGYLSGTISLGAVLIPSLGGILASMDWRYVFLVYGLSLLLALFFFITLPVIPSPGQKQGENLSALPYLGSLFSVLKIRDIPRTLLHSLIAYFLLYTLITFLPLFLMTNHGFTEVHTGLAISLFGFFSALFSSKVHFFAKYLNWSKRVTLGFFLMALCFFLLPYYPQGNYLICISLVLYGMGMGIVIPTIFDQITQLPPAQLAGSVIAIFNTMKFVGMTLSPLIFGLLLNKTSLGMIFTLVGFLALSWALLTLKTSYPFKSPWIPF